MTLEFGKAIVFPLTTSAEMGCELRMLWVEARQFTLGAGYHRRFGSYTDDLIDEPFRVTISAGFWLGQFPVTQRQWEALTGANPSYFKQPDAPVECVSWYDARAFAESLNELRRDVLPPGYRFELPSEAQWELACAADSTTLYSSGEIDQGLSNTAWYLDNSERRTHPVGQKLSNAWGFFDMHGNIAEWCRDWAGDYPTEPQLDWVGPEYGEWKVHRGGTWASSTDGLELATRCRAFSEPNARCPFIGFRLCACLCQ